MIMDFKTAVFLLLLLGKISDVSALTELRGDGLILDATMGYIDMMGDGGVNIDSDFGDVRVTASSGDVDITGQNGVDVTSGSGSVDVSGESGVTIDSATGDIVVNAGQGDIDIDAQGGISMDAANGDVIVQGVNIGGIDDRFDAVLNGLQATVDLMTAAETGGGTLPSLTFASSATGSIELPVGEYGPIGDYATTVSCPSSCFLTMTHHSHVNAYVMAPTNYMMVMFYVDDVNVAEEQAGREYAFHTYGTDSGFGYAPCNFVQMAGPFAAGDHQVVLQGKGDVNGWFMNYGYIEIMATRA